MDLTLENLDAVESPEFSAGETVALAGFAALAGVGVGMLVAAAIIT